MVYSQIHELHSDKLDNGNNPTKDQKKQKATNASPAERQYTCLVSSNLFFSCLQVTVNTRNSNPLIPKLYI